MNRRGLWLLGLLSIVLALPARASDTVVYYLTDTLHSTVVVTDAQRNVIETTHYAPYGAVLNRPLRNGPGYGGHQEDAATGLVYMQQRYYDSESGRFLSPDPVQVDGNGGSFNRYWYANDNPYRYTDPDGRNITEFIGGLFVETAHFVTGQGFNGSAVAGALADGYNGEGGGALHAALQDVGTLSVVAGGAGALRAAGSLAVKEVAAKGETELVQRAMSRAELKATQETGLVRGGRPGTHYASDSVNSSAGRAQQRLALPNKPEVKVTMEVPKGKFSSPTRVEPNNNMPGGGMERTAAGKIPATVKRVDELKQ